MKYKQKRFHLWFPDLFGSSQGGIQAYSNFFLSALQSLYPKLKSTILIKHDTHYDADTFSHQTSYHVTGKWPLPLRTYMFAAKILGFGIQQRPDLVISTHLNFTAVAYWLKQLMGIPYWTMAYGIEAWDVRKNTLKTALHHADYILSISRYTRDRLLKEQHLDPNKISLLPATFDANRFQIAPKSAYLLERYGLTSEQPIVLTVARLAGAEHYKGYDKIIAALPQIRQVIPNLHYVLVGKGNDKPRIERLISQLQLQNCVTLTGFVPDHELNDHYNICDVFAMPSLGEGFGIVYLEALACGKPTLGGNQDGTVDALCDGELGALVDPNDTEAIAQTLIQILQGNYPNRLIYQPEALRQKVIDTFGFEVFKQTLAGHLERYFTSTPIQ